MLVLIDLHLIWCHLRCGLKYSSKYSWNIRRFLRRDGWLINTGSFLFRWETVGQGRVANIKIYAHTKVAVGCSLCFSYGHRPEFFFLLSNTTLVANEPRVRIHPLSVPHFSLPPSLSFHLLSLYLHHFSSSSPALCPQITFSPASFILKNHF